MKAFIWLQLFDIISTLIGFSVGLSEANPVLRHFFPVLGPVAGLFVGKLLTASIVYFYASSLVEVKRRNLWRLANTCFVLLVVYNFTIISIGVIGASV